MKSLTRVILSILVVGLVIINAPRIYAEDAPKQQPTDEKIVYLTFDDGPTRGVTDDIMDQLKKHDVKGTFFVVGKEIQDKEAVLKRMHEEGHGIGLHTYSHNYKKVYSSPDMFIKEMEETQTKINEVLGEDVKINYIRFPGGSAGRLNQDFYNLIKSKGYTIFDWNVNLEDGVNPNASVYELVENAKKARDKINTKIVLAHCNLNNKNTVKALDGIIEYYKSQGYTFDKITNDTPEYYYQFKK
ncbi:MAG: polysaccharide deacetylase [Epulopiscium sp. Nele67-Bin004]|nr:MAG: polysaccharide deacetylase [Epulopiscium sp. Nele67-Bin004]